MHFKNSSCKQAKFLDCFCITEYVRNTLEINGNQNKGSNVLEIEYFIVKMKKKLKCFFHFISIFRPLKPFPYFEKKNFL